MTKQVIWVEQVIQAFVDEGNLNERQEKIIRMRSKGYSLTEQADILGVSYDTIDKETQRLKRIYDATQKNSKTLPPRVVNSKDLFNK